MKSIAVTWTTGSQSFAAQRRSIAISNNPATRTESLAGMPHVGATNGVKDGVHSVACETVNFFYEVLTLIINRNTAQARNGRCPPR